LSVLKALSLKGLSFETCGLLNDMLRISLHRDQAFRGIVIARFAHRDHPFRAS
jgi:hypothetical protein